MVRSSIRSQAGGAGSTGFFHVFASTLILATSLAVPRHATAQEPQLHTFSPHAVVADRAQSPQGFLFRSPIAHLTLRGGFNFAMAGSDLFDLATDQFTLDKSDFSAFLLGGDMAIQVHDRLDILGGVAFLSTKKASEYREYVDENDLPITQETRFMQIPLTLGARYYLMPRGQQIGRFVWIPTKVVPYIGAAGGAVRWEFEQVGSFVDFEDLGIFDDHFFSEGWTVIGQGLAGFDYSLNTRIALNTEARYTFGSAELSRDFEGFDPLDLSGLQVTMGLKFRF